MFHEYSDSSRQVIQLCNSWQVTTVLILYTIFFMNFHVIYFRNLQFYFIFLVGVMRSPRNFAKAYF